MMNLSIIVAMSLNRVIGVKNSLPCHISTYLKHFKQITTGHRVVMGRKTYESIGKALPNRDNYVLTRNKNLKIKDVFMISSLSELPDDSSKKSFIIGGGEIYKQSLDFCSEIIVTKIHHVIEGDTYFPELNNEAWLKVEESEIFQEKDVRFSFIIYKKR